jgi:putative intracellular protease/amidase
MVSGRTRLVFLAGDPIGHTRGYAEYAEAFAAAGLDAAYLPAAVPPEGFAAFLTGLRQMRNVAGVVATIPHKPAAFAASRPDAAARRAGAANLLRPGEGGGWESTMLDGAGFLAATRAAGIALAGRRVQMLGAGGARHPRSGCGPGRGARRGGAAGVPGPGGRSRARCVGDAGELLAGRHGRGSQAAAAGGADPRGRRGL